MYNRKKREDDEKIDIKENTIAENPEEIKTKVINKEKETELIINVIHELENCYKTKNFDKWKSFLSPNYKERYNNPVLLKEEGWNAKDLKSFFNLLVETRKRKNISTLEISRIEFVNSDRACVYVIFQGEEFPKPQHTFIRIAGKWYKDLKIEGN